MEFNTEALQDLDLSQVKYEAEAMRADYLKGLFAKIGNALTNLLSIDLPDFIQGPLAHR